ncbi:hypothetical protein [Streptomyces regalis]|uniref:hypothetical protein n=1 Tax=Streptomyces regalis TaxID=68262 RepID=UPI00131D59AF|nr:hypothetical protein [Streptomyces regalis]
MDPLCGENVLPAFGAVDTYDRGATQAVEVQRVPLKRRTSIGAQGDDADLCGAAMDGA